jgi:hypothetical protein
MLGIDHPLFLEELVDEFLLRLNPGLEYLHILGPKHFAHCLDRKQVLPLGFGRLPLSVLSQSASRYNAVQMRMKAERLSPSVENGDHPGFGSQILWIFGKGGHRLPCGFKQTVIDSLGLVHSQLIQGVWQSKDDPDTRDRL